MNTKSSTLSRVTVQRVERLGEGYAVDVSVLKTGSQLASLTFSINDAPVPDRRFSCDAVDITSIGSRVRLCFAQSNLVGDGWLAMVAINMSREGVTYFLRSVAASEAKPKFDAFVIGQEAALTPFTTPPSNSVILSANLVAAGFLGSDGCLDFYSASVFAFQRAPVTNKLQVEPVVRINLPAELIFAIVRKLQELYPAESVKKII